MNDKLNIAKKECCHFFEDYNGERNICLLIEKPCVLSQGLNCTYFKSSVRPDHEGKTKKCKRCNNDFIPDYPQEKYYTKCKPIIKKEKARLRKQKQRG